MGGGGGGGGQGFERGTGRTRMGDGGLGGGVDAGSECRLWLWTPSLNWQGQLRPAETIDTAVVRSC